MIVHITKKLADKLKLSPPPEGPTDALFSWRANYVQESGVRFVVFMNDASRFTIVLNEANAAKLKKLQGLFVQTLRETLLAAGVNPEVADRYIAESGNVAYAKNSDREKTAQLNKNVVTARWALHNFADDVDLSVYANKRTYYTSGRDEGWNPTEKMIELLGQYGLPVRKCRAYDLNARLDLDGRDAVRRLRVPADMTFERLHSLLQTAFAWHNYHLYSFGLFKEWGEKYYTEPDVELVVSEEDLEFSPDAILMAGVKLSDYVPEYRNILYTYDYGDDWSHFIELEQIIDDCEEQLPILLSAEGDAPPEDVGGPGGFEEFLEIINDPENEDYEEMSEWARMQWWRPLDFDNLAGKIKAGR